MFPQWWLTSTPLSYYGLLNRMWRERREGEIRLTLPNQSVCGCVYEGTYSVTKTKTVERGDKKDQGQGQKESLPITQEYKVLDYSGFLYAKIIKHNLVMSLLLPKSK